MHTQFEGRINTHQIVYIDITEERSCHFSSFEWLFALLTSPCRRVFDSVVMVMSASLLHDRNLILYHRTSIVPKRTSEAAVLNTDVLEFYHMSLRCFLSALSPSFPCTLVKDVRQKKFTF